MKILLLITALAGIASGQTITLTVGGVSPSVIADLGQAWKDKAGPVIGTTSAAIDAANDTITLDQTKLTAAPAMPKVGDTVLVDSEPCMVKSVGDTLTLDRGKFEKPVAHPAGSPVVVLRYRTPYEMIVAEALLPYVQGTINALGTRSATLGARVTGSITP